MERHCTSHSHHQTLNLSCCVMWSVSMWRTGDYSLTSPWGMFQEGLRHQRKISTCSIHFRRKPCAYSSNFSSKPKSSHTVNGFSTRLFESTLLSSCKCHLTHRFVWQRCIICIFMNLVWGFGLVFVGKGDYRQYRIGKNWLKLNHYPWSFLIMFNIYVNKC